MGEKRWVLMSDLFCLFLGLVAVGVFYFGDGGEQMSFFTGSIMNQEGGPLGELFEEWESSAETWENDAEVSIDTPVVHIGRGEIQGRPGQVVELGREGEVRWIEETEMDIEKFMSREGEIDWALAVGAGEGRCREIWVSRSSIYRVRQIEFEQFGAMEFKISLDIVVRIEVEGDSGGRRGN